MEIIKFQKLAFNNSYLTISILGKVFKLSITYSSTSEVEIINEASSIKLLLPKAYKKTDNTEIINLALQKLYNEIAYIELENCMEFARFILGFSPEDYIIKRLKNSYFKCTRDKVIIINPDIIQFNKDIIYSTIIQAFCKIRYSVSSKAYKQNLAFALKKYEQYKSTLESNILSLKIS